MLYGEGGNDTLIGGMYGDVLDGGSGNNVLDGGADRDTMLLPGVVEDYSVSLNADGSYRFTGSGVVNTVRSIEIVRLGGLQNGTSYEFNNFLALVAGNTGNDVPRHRSQSIGDYDGDGRSDILWRNSDGALSTWETQGVAGTVRLQPAVFNARVDAGWKVAETFDMDGDGRFDILWRNDNGLFSVWKADGTGGFRQGSYTDGSVGNDWAIAATGDINGDGRDDLLFRRGDGAISSWNSAGSGFAPNSYFHASVGASWKVAGLADFDGDGRDDLLWRNENGALAIWRGSRDGFIENSYVDATVPASSGWHIAGLGDFSGDGRDDIVWRNDSGALSVWQSDGASRFFKATYNAVVSTDWSIAQVGDFNADKRADLLWHNVNGAVSIWQSNGAGFDQNTLYDAGAANSWQIQSHDFVI